MKGKRVAAVAAARTKTKQNSIHPKSVQIPAQLRNRHRHRNNQQQHNYWCILLLVMNICEINKNKMILFTKKQILFPVNNLDLSEII